MAHHGPASPLRLDDRAVVGRVRLRAAWPVDAGAARLRIERLLAGDALRVPGVPSSAVLCVRTMRDPLPDALRLDARNGSSAEWEHAVRGALEREARAAARPIEGGVTSGATAVLFRDRAELLACLASDWTRGLVAHEWWWRHLLRPSVEASRAAPLQWLADAAFVPAATRWLATRGELTAFVQALTIEEAGQLVAGVLETFGLGSDGEDRAPSTSDANDRGAGRTDARWESLAPEVVAMPASGAARAFAVLSLGLARAPALARRPAFVALVRAWAFTSKETRGTSVDARATLGTANDPSATSGALDDRRAALAPEAEKRAGIGQEARGGTEATFDARGKGEAHSAATADPERYLAPHSAADPDGASGSRVPRSIDPSAADDEIEARARGARDPGAERERGDLERPLNAIETSATESPLPALERSVSEVAPAHSPARPSLIGRTIATQYGGVFFLINALLVLEIYGDFTRPRARMLETSPWRAIGAMARKLLGDRIEAGDGVWPLLNELGAAPDAAIEEWPLAFRVKPEWLASFHAGDAWLWDASAQRMRIRHPAGFTVIDVPRKCDETLDAQLEREIAPFGSMRLAPGASPDSDPRYEWLDCLTEFLRARIHLALRAEDPEASARLLLHLGARVQTSELHIDVRASLAELPVEVRLAGLDRDPGWVPAAGRFVAFHFD